MKHTAILLAITISCAAFGQRDAYVKQNWLMDSAQFLAYHGRHADALAIYDQMVDKEFSHPGSYFDLIRIGLLSGQPAKANEFLSIAVQHGFVPELFYGDSLLMAFLQSPEAGPFREQRSRDEQVFASRADSALIKELDSLVFLDQRVRHTNGGPWKEHTVDSLNFDRLVAIFEKHGFPDPQTMGNGMGNIHLLLWHHRSPEYPGSDQWKRALPHIHAAIERGSLNPAYLCMFEDYDDHEAGRPMRYGTLLYYYYKNNPEDLFFVDRAALDRNRASVGLGPISWFAQEQDFDLSKARFAAP